MVARVPRAVALALVLAGIPAWGATLVVAPRPGTPIQDAIDAAAPGDRIRILAGSYPEHLVVGKPLTIIGYGAAGGVPVVDAGCGVGIAFDIHASNVKVRNVMVRGGTTSGVDASATDKLTLNRIIVLQDCSASYGIRVTNGSHLTLTRNLVDVGTRPQWLAAALALIAPNGPAKVSGNQVRGGVDGILVSQAVLPPGSRSGAAVIGNTVAGNDVGILLSSSSAVRVQRNTVTVNDDRGIQADAGTHDAFLVSNVASGNGLDVLDEGTANCWHRNVYTTGSVQDCP